CLAVIALALAGFAGHLNVRKEIHLNHFHPSALAGFTTPAFDIERKTTRLIATDLRFWQVNEKIPDVGEHACIGRRRGDPGTTDARLFDFDYLIDVLQALNLLILEWCLLRAEEMMVQIRIKRLSN